MRRSLQRAIGLLTSIGLVMLLALPVAAADEAFVRVVHASPDAPNVDVWVDGTKVLTDVPFTAVSDYLAVPAGDHNVQVTATGSTDPVIDEDLTLTAGTSYTVAATGLVADIAATVLVDDRTPVEGKAKLRVFHASPSAPASVDVAVTGGPVLVEALAYPKATGYLTVDAGAYALEIRAAGAADAALSLNATLEAGQNYTAIAMDGGSAGVQVIIATEAATLPNTAMEQPTAPLAAFGLLLVALAGGFVARRLAVRTRA
jgi:LPXTG-motif cell wall-anchored protein